MAPEGDSTHTEHCATEVGAGGVGDEILADERRKDIYLAALENGHRPDDEVVDGPVMIGTWKPGNYEGSYEGAITLSHALAHSSNSAAVQLTNEVGPAAVVRVAHRLGVSTALHAVPSLALGTSEVTPLELTAGYTAAIIAGDELGAVVQPDLPVGRAAADD